MSAEQLVIPLEGGAYDGEVVRFFTRNGELLFVAPVIYRGDRASRPQRYVLQAAYGLSYVADGEPIPPSRRVAARPA